MRIRELIKKSAWLLPLILVLIIGSEKLLSQTKVMNLDDAIKIALDSNSSMKIAVMNVMKAEAAVDEAFGYALPSVNLSGYFTRFIEKSKMPFPDFEAMLNNAVYGTLFNENIIPYDPNKFKPIAYTLQSFALANNFQAKAEVTQILFNSAVFRGIGASKIYYNVSRELLKSTTAKTILDVKKAFYGVLLTQELLKIMNDSYKNAQDNYNNVKAMNNQGLVSEYDLMQVEVKVENIKPSIVLIENSLKNIKDGLKLLMGVPQSVDFSVEGELKYINENLPDENALIALALKNNLDLSSLELKKQVDNEFIHLDLSEYWPSVVAFGNLNYAGSSDDFNFQTYREAMVGVQLSINLYNGGQTSNRVQKSTINFQHTEEQLYQLKNYITMQVKSKILDIKRVQSQLESQERTVNLAQKAYTLSTVRYKEGTGTQLEIQNSEMELRLAKQTYLQSVYDYIIAKSQLDELLGNVEVKYLNFIEKYYKQ